MGKESDSLVGKESRARVSRGDGWTRDLPLRPRGVDAVEVSRADGTTGTVRDILDTTFTDAFAVVHRGSLVSEWYAPDSGPDRLHPVWSVTKGFVGCVAGALLDRGVLEEGRRVADYVPELSSSGYAEATVRDLLDMRSGVRFREDYTDPASDIRLLDEWVQGPRGLYEFLATLEADRPHGGHFLYRSSETDVLGWVCERAAASPMPALVSELVWRPMGAEHDAEMLRDERGTAIHDGGLGATARDLLRFGLLLLEGGAVALPGGESRQVVAA
ncbi:MAG: serine hydrolase domain-containing protein, partial [Nocardioides sp.]